MPLQSGTRLGAHEVTALIDQGGMGEVYKARDTRLERIVAIKVLPEHEASDPDLKQRFEREARTVAALNHPHICTLHDIGQQDGTLGNCCCTLANTWARIVAPLPPRTRRISLCE